MSEFLADPFAQYAAPPHRKILAVDRVFEIVAENRVLRIAEEVKEHLLAGTTIEALHAGTPSALPYDCNAHRGRLNFGAPQEELRFIGAGVELGLGQAINEAFGKRRLCLGDINAGEVGFTGEFAADNPDLVNILFSQVPLF